MRPERRLRPADRSRGRAPSPALRFLDYGSSPQRDKSKVAASPGVLLWVARPGSGRIAATDRRPTKVRSNRHRVFSSIRGPSPPNVGFTARELPSRYRARCPCRVVDSKAVLADISYPMHRAIRSGNSRPRGPSPGWARRGEASERADLVGRRSKRRSTVYEPARWQPFWRRRVG